MYTNYTKNNACNSLELLSTVVDLVNWSPPTFESFKPLFKCWNILLRITPQKDDVTTLSLRVNFLSTVLIHRKGPWLCSGNEIEKSKKIERDTASRNRYCSYSVSRRL